MKTKIKEVKYPRCNRFDDGTIHRDGKFVDLTIHQNDKTPHWQRYGSGSFHLEADGPIHNGESDESRIWLQFEAIESAEKSQKKVMFTLRKNEIERLRDLCDLVLGAVIA